MTSAFVQRKRVLGFYFFDISKDGLVRGEDFTVWGKSIASAMNMEEGSESYNKVVAGFEEYWNAFGASADANGNGAISLDEFLSAYEALVSLPNAQEIVANANMPIFDAIDTDGTGTISAKEFAIYLAPGGVSEAQAHEAFKHLDADGSGVITSDEFGRAAFEYWNSEDPNARGNWMYGIR